MQIRTVARVLSRPTKFLHWLFKHNPWITFVELVVIGAIHAYVIFPLILLYFGVEHKNINEWLRWGLVGFMSYLSIIGATSYTKHSDFREDFEKSNYDVFKLTVREYLEARGAGIFMSYVMIATISVVLGVLIGFPFSILAALYFFIFH